MKNYVKVVLYYNKNVLLICKEPYSKLVVYDL